MGYTERIDGVQKFVSELTAEELAEYHRRANWLAETHFQPRHIESFDLGNIFRKYMTAEITVSYRRGERRIWYYIDKRLVFTQRVEAGQGVRKIAEEYYAAQKHRARQHKQIGPRKVTV